MVIDTSALLAILQDEPERRSFNEAIEAAESCALSVANFVEVSIVIEGQIGFRSEDREAVLAPGGYIVKPRGEVHAMWNAGDVPARMIEIITPAGFDKFFRELAAANAERPMTPPEVAEMAARYELPFADPDWMGDVIERYGLTPPF